MENDDLLERAIASYSAVEPGLGFERRLLDRARAKQRNWVWAAVPVMAVAAGVCIAIMVSNQTPEAVMVVQRTVAVPVMDPGPLPAERRVRTRARRHRLREPIPELTSEEQVLVRWVERSPETARADWAMARERFEAPLEMKVLEIQPLTIEEINQ